MTTGVGHRVELGAWAEELGALEVLEEGEEEEEYWEEVIFELIGITINT